MKCISSVAACGFGGPPSAVVAQQGRGATLPNLLDAPVAPLPCLRQGTSTAQDPKYTSKNKQKLLNDIAKRAPKELFAQKVCVSVAGSRQWAFRFSHRTSRSVVAAWLSTVCFCRWLVA